MDVTVTQVHNHNWHREVRPVVLTASESNPAVVKCEITFLSDESEALSLNFSPVLRLSTQENGAFPFIDLSKQELRIRHEDGNGKHTNTAKFHAEFTVHPVNFSQALAICGIIRDHHTQIQGEINSTYCFESSFLVIVDSTHSSQTRSTNCNHSTEVLVTSIVTGIFGLLTLSLLAIVGFLFLKLRRAGTSDDNVNPLLYVRKEDVDSEQKKDTLEREAQYPSNGSSARKVGIDHKLPDTIKSRENNTHFP